MKSIYSRLERRYIRLLAKCGINYHFRRHNATEIDKTTIFIKILTTNLR